MSQYALFDLAYKKQQQRRSQLVVSEVLVDVFRTKPGLFPVFVLGERTGCCCFILNLSKKSNKHILIKVKSLHLKNGKICCFSCSLCFEYIHHNISSYILGLPQPLLGFRMSLLSFLLIFALILNSFHFTHTGIEAKVTCKFNLY